VAAQSAGLSVRPLVWLAAFVAAAALAQVVAGAWDRHAHPRRGLYADAGGHRLRLLVGGTAHAGPTVLLETGIGGATSVTWAWVQRGVERFAPVVSYDRAGLGESEPGPMPRDGRRLVEEFHTALRNAGLHGPYVFAGHSYGGLLARLFVDRYPDEVAGVVLLESSHPRQFVPARGRPPAFLRVLRALVPAAPWVARLGLMRAFVTVVRTDADLLPPRERAEQKAFLASPAHWEGVAREMEAWAPLTSPQAARARDFGSRPLAVLTAGTSAARARGWHSLQDDLVTLSNDSVHRIVPGATHGSLIADSTHAQAVIATIHDVVQAVREGGRLRDIVPSGN